MEELVSILMFVFVAVGGQDSIAQHVKLLYIYIAMYILYCLELQPGRLFFPVIFTQATTK